MADTKISALTDLPTPLSTDITVVVSDPGGTPVTKKMTLAALAATVLAVLKAAGSDVTTGTSELLAVTPKALADAGVNTRLKSKVIAATRDLSAADGDVAYTGVGFTPTAILMIGGNDGGALNVGVVDSAKGDGGLGSLSGAFYGNLPNFIQITVSSGNVEAAVVKTFDADGFTLTWTKTGSPTGTGRFFFLCFK